MTGSKEPKIYVTNILNAVKFKKVCLPLYTLELEYDFSNKHPICPIYTTILFLNIPLHYTQPLSSVSYAQMILFQRNVTLHRISQSLYRKLSELVC